MWVAAEATALRPRGRSAWRLLQLVGSDGARRCFGKSRYLRLLWKPSFPSDLPPALRQNAAVMRHAAPEVSPHKETWTIHASRRLYDIAPDLCARGAVHELAANVVYRALAAMDCTNFEEATRREREFRSDLFTACSNLFEVHHVHRGAEVVFGIFNTDTLRAISPTMKKSKRHKLRELVLDVVEEWVLSHEESFSRIDAHALFEVTGPKAFYRLIPYLRLDVRALPPEDVEVLFYHFAEEAKSIFDVMRIAISLLPVETLQSPLGGSSWTLRRVLGIIEQRQSDHSLRFFLSNLHPPALLMEALLALRERDFDTGLLRDEWSFAASVQIQDDVLAGRPVAVDVPNMWPMLPAPPVMLLPPRDPVDVDTEVPRGQRLWLTDGEFRPFRIKAHPSRPLAAVAPPSRLRDAAWPQVAFDPAEALEGSSASTAADAYDALAGRTEDMDPLQLWGGGGSTALVRSSRRSSSSHPGLPAPDSSLPLDAIHFVDTAQALSHTLTYLKGAQLAFVGVDLEWSDPYPVSIIQIATPSRAFVIDCVNRTPLYMSVLHVLMDWLLKKEEITKLFFGFPHDLLRLNMLFEAQGKSFATADHIASVLDLYMQRIRRVAMYQPLPEHTPLGREALLGEAMMRDDFDEVRRIGAEVPPHPPAEELAERVYTVGGHHSLASMTERYLGEPLEKGLRASNWNFRPLAAAQVIYAATDAHVLLRLEAAMRERGILPQRLFGCGPRAPWLQQAWWRVEPAAEEGKQPRLAP